MKYFGNLNSSMNRAIYWLKLSLQYEIGSESLYIAHVFFILNISIKRFLTTFSVFLKNSKYENENLF